MTEDEKALWERVNSFIENSAGSSVYKIYANRLGLEIVDEKHINILCPDTHAKALLEKNLKDTITEALNSIKGGKHTVSFKTSKVKLADEKKPLPMFDESDFIKRIEEKNLPTRMVEVSGISPRYKFENYLMGSNNQLAFAVAKAVSEHPGDTYNPLFIYSGVGLGKTHLMQAVGNELVRNKPSLKVVYTTGEAFTNELIEAIQTSKGRGQYTINKFRAKFRNADVLLVDDIQFIVGRETTQEEFFHTFNTLYMGQKQIVLTSDRPPKDFVNLEERIKSRFGSGMIVDIQPPDFDMRVAILRQKRDDSSDPISNEVIDVIARVVDTNIRELLGSYLQILTKATAEGIDITPDKALKELGQRVDAEKKKPVNINQILKAVCNYYSVKSDDLKGQRRTKEFVIPRQIVMYLIYDLTKTPYMTIGEFLGGRDHTTVLHGIRKIEEEVKTDQRTKQDITNIVQNVYNA